MTERAHRTTRHRKLPDTFERLRAQAKESKTTNPVQHWLNQTLLTPTKSTISPPTGGNRLPPFPCVKLKRKISYGFTMELRSKKTISAGSVDDGHSAKGKEVVAIEVPQRQQKLEGKAREGDAVDVSGDILGNEGQPSSEEAQPGGGHLAIGMEIPHEVSRGERAPIPVAMSSPSKTTNSRSMKTASPTKKKLPVLTKRARMKFASPRIIFNTVIFTNQSGYLKGTLAELWQHMNRREGKVIPYEVKVSDAIMRSNLLHC